MADRKISDLTALTTPATGDLIPIVDISEAAAADKNKSITVGELLRGAPDGTAAAPGIAFESDGGNGMFLGGTDILAFSTGGTQAVTIDASQRLGIGTSSPSSLLHLSSSSPKIQLTRTSTGADHILDGDSGVGSFWVKVDDNAEGSSPAFIVNVAGSETLRVDSSGRLGIGTTSPQRLLHLDGGSGGVQIQLTNDTTGKASDGDGFQLQLASDGTARVTQRENLALAFDTNNNERARIDSSGRLLVGTSSTSGDGLIVVEGRASAGGSHGLIQLSRGDTNIPSGNGVGAVEFTNNAAGIGAKIYAVADANWTSGSSHPTRLEFSTTADGASSPTERMRITNGGTVCINTVNTQTARFSIEGSSQALYNAVFHDTRPGSTGTSTSILFKRDTAVVGGISTTSTSTAFNTSSDYRLKENIVPLTGAADRLNQLQVRRFNFIADPDTTVDGFIAHEAQAVVPECVTGTKDEVDENGDPVYQGIDQSKLVPLLTAALQEAIGRIETLEAEVAALKAS